MGIVLKTGKVKELGKGSVPSFSWFLTDFFISYSGFFTGPVLGLIQPVVYFIFLDSGFGVKSSWISKFRHVLPCLFGIRLVHHGQPD